MMQPDRLEQIAVERNARRRESALQNKELEHFLADTQPENAPALVVGLAAEARIARRLGWPVAIGGGTRSGARVAAETLIEQGATALVSFGLAGGLDPALRPGTMIVPSAVRVEGGVIQTDPALSGRLGGATGHLLFGAEQLAVSTADKRRLHAHTGAAAIDLESGAVALAAQAHGLRFAVLRVICDPAERDLPPAALTALDRAGMIGISRTIVSVLRRPAQIPALLRLAIDAAAARRALMQRVAGLARSSG
ncbi:MAG TPA: hypothetical protein VIG49_00490 [Acetobacteraceae bacterium]